jgi:hypothetical protein
MYRPIGASESLDWNLPCRDSGNAKARLVDDIKQKPPPELITAGAHSHCADGWFEARGEEPRCRAKDPLEDQIPLKRFSQGQPLGSERGTVASPAPSTKSRRWNEISDGLLFVTDQQVRTRMSLKL